MSMNSDDKDRINAALAITELSRSIQRGTGLFQSPDFLQLLGLPLAINNSAVPINSEGILNKNDANCNGNINTSLPVVSMNYAPFANNPQLLALSQFGTVPVIIVQAPMPAVQGDVANVPTTVETDIGDSKTNAKKNKVGKRKSADSEVKSKDKSNKKSPKPSVAADNENSLEKSTAAICKEESAGISSVQNISSMMAANVAGIPNLMALGGNLNSALNIAMLPPMWSQILNALKQQEQLWANCLSNNVNNVLNNQSSKTEQDDNKFVPISAENGTKTENTNMKQEHNSSIIPPVLQTASNAQSTIANAQSIINLLQKPRLQATNSFLPIVSMQNLSSISNNAGQSVYEQDTRLADLNNVRLSNNNVLVNSHCINDKVSQNGNELSQLVFAKCNSVNGKIEHFASSPSSPVATNSDQARPASAGYVFQMSPNGDALSVTSETRSLPPKKRRVLDRDGHEIRSESPSMSVQVSSPRILQLESVQDKGEDQAIQYVLSNGECQTALKPSGLIFNNSAQNVSSRSVVIKNSPQLQQIQHMQQMSSVNRPDEDGDFPIHIAVVQGDITVVRRILLVMKQVGMSVDVINHLRQTPMHLAIITKKDDLVQLLLEFGASVSIQNRKGHNCFHIAIHTGAVDCLRVLIARHKDRADLNALDYDGCSPLHLAVKMSNSAAIGMLLQAGVIDIDLADGKSGRTALFHAVEMNKLDIAKQLLEAGANFSYVNYSGVAPVDVANGRQHDAMVKLLEQYGAEAGSKDRNVDFPSPTDSPMVEKGKKKRGTANRRAPTKEITSMKPKKAGKVKVLGLESLQQLTNSHTSVQDGRVERFTTVQPSLKLPSDRRNDNVAISSGMLLSNEISSIGTTWTIPKSQELLAASMLTAFKKRDTVSSDTVHQSLLAAGLGPSVQLNPVAAVIGSERSRGVDNGKREDLFTTLDNDRVELGAEAVVESSVSDEDEDDVSS